MKKTLIALVAVLLMQTSCFAELMIIDSEEDSNISNIPNSSNSSNNLNSNFHKGAKLNMTVATLTQAINLNSANIGYLDSPSELFKMFTKRLNIVPGKTTNNSFYYDDTKLTFVNLKDTCKKSADVFPFGETTACAKILVKYNDINEEYKLYLYKDAVKPAINSSEKNLMNTKFKYDF